MRLYLRTAMFCLSLVRRSRRRLQVLAVVALSFLALSPVAEVYLVREIADYILNRSQEAPDGFDYLFALQILGVLGVLYVVRHFTRVARIRYMNHLVDLLGEDETSLTLMQRAWLRSTLLEQSLQWTAILQIVVLALVCLWISAAFAVVFVVAVLASLAFSLSRFSREAHAQKKHRFNKRDDRDHLNARKVFTRVRSAEVASAFTSALVGVLLLAILGLVGTGTVTPLQALVSLFVVRLYNMTAGMFSGSAMRMARALAYVEESFPVRETSLQGGKDG